MAERRFSSDLPTPLVVAHRGASADEPENTLAAFEAAVEAGADAVEFDVRMSGDGHAVVMHDPSVDRTTDGFGLVRDLTVPELKRLRIRSSSGVPAEIPVLAEVLALLSGRCALDVEIKQLPGEPDHDPELAPVVDATLRALDDAAFVGPVLISSFDPRSLARVRELDAAMPTGLLSLAAMPAEDAVRLASEAGYGWVLPAAAPVLEGGVSLVERVHGAGLLLGTWIVDDPGTAQLLGSWGVDAVATNDPRGVLQALRGRTSR